MGVSRKKISRKIEAGAATIGEFPPAWSFALTDERGEKTSFDFRELQAGGRTHLAAHARDAIWSQRFECRPATLKIQVGAIATFMRFLDDHAAAQPAPLILKDINRPLIDRFVGWLNLQLVVDPAKPRHGQPLGLGARSSIYAGVKAFLVNRQRHVPNEVSSELGFPRNPFPNRNRSAKKREGYSGTVHKRIVAALNADLRAIHMQSASPQSSALNMDQDQGVQLLPLQVLAVHLIVLGLATGRNLQPLLDLTRDGLQEHPAPDRDLLVTRKHRGYRTHASSLRKVAVKPEPSMQPIPASIGDHLRFLMEYTAPLAKEARSIGDFVFLWRHTKYTNKDSVAVLNGSNAYNAVRAFAKRHELKDDDGQPLKLNMARLRPTFATEIYRRTGDVRRVQQALGHASAKTAARHYIGILPEAERNHSFVVEGLAGQFAKFEVGGKVVLAADGAIPAANVKDLLASGYSTGIASCKNPFREEDSVCKKFFSCFRCPSMMVFEDDLWRLFSFYYRLLSERAKVGSVQWLKTYAPIVKRIDVDIATQFPSAAVEAARLRAQASPHPTWR